MKRKRGKIYEPVDQHSAGAPSLGTASQDRDRQAPRIAPAQRILENRGYLVTCSGRTMEPGEVLPHLQAEGYQDIAGPLVVIAETDYADWLEQYRQYHHSPSESAAAKQQASGHRYYRLIAE